MSVYKKVEVVGTSTKSYEDAIQGAVDRTGKTVHNLAWFEVKELRGGIAKGKLEYQAVIVIAFKLDEV